MLKLEDLKKDAQVRGLAGDKIVRIVMVEPVGDDAANVFYVDADGKPGTQMLFRSDEARLEIAKAGRPWAFDAPGAEFKLGLEAYCGIIGFVSALSLALRGKCGEFL